MRITLTHKELHELQKLCLENDNHELFNKLSHEEHKSIKSRTVKKTKATQKATKVRQDTARKKIESTVNMMRLFNQKITVYSVAKEAQVSYNTANKYKEYIQRNAH
ncbi:MULTISPECIES: hypothetical protein [Malaciobacter]|uniref:Uncharacterized protein n=2 Tax=Malaciobacter TaxID=2321114 RepID=A0AB36ZW67_9BACT|nr:MULTISPECIES: hypothetical protein [Malaciobacter]PHO10910.1 hypothetical protein CPG37_00235 [Malaciobacter canalis]PPK60807.1 hypothetical protein B0F89_11657 [Malaciobacter marinus]QEE32983.1 hypothetical protein ACAN_1507 [Malaciobacter canalis]SKB41085.1 hypothetical protein SAMN06295997_11032 [Malaciobacter marinus]